MIYYLFRAVFDQSWVSNDGVSTFVYDGHALLRLAKWNIIEPQFQDCDISTEIIGEHGEEDNG